jgi:hypothetical protein
MVSMLEYFLLLIPNSRMLLLFMWMEILCFHVYSIVTLLYLQIQKNFLDIPCVLFRLQFLCKGMPSELMSSTQCDFLSNLQLLPHIVWHDTLAITGSERFFSLDYLGRPRYWGSVCIDDSSASKYSKDLKFVAFSEVFSLCTNALILVFLLISCLSVWKEALQLSELARKRGHKCSSHCEWCKHTWRLLRALPYCGEDIPVLVSRHEVSKSFTQ